jgi:hypothetical protein
MSIFYHNNLLQFIPQENSITCSWLDTGKTFLHYIWVQYSCAISTGVIHTAMSQSRASGIAKAGRGFYVSSFGAFFAILYKNEIIVEWSMFVKLQFIFYYEEEVI